MQTTKIFLMAALALLTAACNNDDTNILTPVEQPAKSEGIPFTATISMGESASTRALTENGTTIEATWAENDEVALIHNGVIDKVTVASVSGGVATISGTITGSPTTGDAVTVIYPYDAADGTTGNVKANLLAAQDGTLATIAANYDVRKGIGTLKVSGTASLNGNVSLTNQFAIWKLTLANIANNAKNLSIMADDITIAGATLGTAGKEFIVAVPAVSSKTVTIVANDESNNCYYFSKASVTIAAGKYYQSSPTMTALGDNSSADVYKMTAAGTIPDGKTVVLSGVNISGSLECSGDATIILMGDNSVTSSTNNKAAIKIGGSGTTLTITGSGSLTAKGGKDAAGIGTNVADDTTLSGGNIVINGGTVHATGGEYAAGIGTGYATNNGKNTCGTITINGGMVYAAGGEDAAAGIGTGSSLENATQTCGDIMITGGTVNATGGYGAAGIGTGVAASVRLEPASNECGAITIGTGVTSVIATKGLDCPNSIGLGVEGFGGKQTCGTITFGTAQVFDGTAATGTWTPNPMVADTYGGLNLAISTTTNTDDTWTLTPAP